jgi:ABC-type nitrate/sulfonate/bicarbonate transport system substrate-binding protein
MSSHSSLRSRRTATRVLLAATAATALAVTAGCSSSATSSTDAASSDGDLTTVTFALSYLPDPALNGLAYAIDQGWFADKGIEVEFVPFSGSPAETLVSTGVADMGWGSDLRSTLLSAAAGADVVSLMAVYQHAPYSLAVLDDSPYQSPADLAGTSFGTFGSPYEAAIVHDMIAADGGSGDVESVMLSTDIYSALSAGRIDSSLAFPGDTWMLEQGGTAIRTWPTTDYGLPDTYSALLLTSSAYMDKNPQIVKDFTQTMQAGYEAALTDREAADAAVIKLFPDDLNPDMVDYVSTIQNEQFFPSESGILGDQTADVWQENADWLISHGLLAGADGKPLTEFDPSKLFTTEYLG